MRAWTTNIRELARKITDLDGTIADNDINRFTHQQPTGFISAIRRFTRAC